MLARLFVAVMLLVAAPLMAEAAGPTYAALYQKKGKFEDVRQDVYDGIVNKGFVVDYNAKIGDMMDRTAKDMGATKGLYAKAEALQFCSARLSRAMFEADPANIVLCPSVMVVFELADKPGIIHVGYRRMPAVGAKKSRQAAFAIEKVMDEIAKAATR